MFYKYYICTTKLKIKNKTRKKMEEKQTLTAEFLQMNTGDVRVYPAFRLTSIRSMASQIGFSHNRKYATRIDKENRTVLVTRIS